MRRGEGLALLALVLAFVAARKKVLSKAQLLALARSNGFRDPDVAAAVALAESGGNAIAVGDVTRGFSYGLWQINVRAHPEHTAGALMDPNYNARAALSISKGGTDWSPWTTFRDGSYKRFLAKGAS